MSQNKNQTTVLEKLTSINEEAQEKIKEIDTLITEIDKISQNSDLSFTEKRTELSIDDKHKNLLKIRTGVKDISDENLTPEQSQQIIDAAREAQVKKFTDAKATYNMIMDNAIKLIEEVPDNTITEQQKHKIIDQANALKDDITHLQTIPELMNDNLRYKKPAGLSLVATEVNPKRHALNTVESIKTELDKGLSELLTNNYLQEGSDLKKKIQSYHKTLKENLSNVSEIYESAPEGLPFKTTELSSSLNKLRNQTNAENIFERKAKGQKLETIQENIANEYARALDNVVNASKKDVHIAEEQQLQKMIDAEEQQLQKMIDAAEQQSLKMTDNERSKQLNEVVGNLVESHPELQKIQDKIQKGASGEQPNFGLKHESYKALYESAQRIQSGTADIQSEVQSMREVINKELPVSRKISSYINKAIDKHMGDENKEATSIKNNENMANVKDTTTVLQEQLAKMEKSGKKLGSSQDPATALQEQLEQTVKNKTITEKDQKKTNTAPEQSHPQPSERDSNSERKTVGNKPKKANLIHTAQQIVSKVTNLIKPAKSDQPDPPPTASKNKTPKNDKGPGI